MIGRRLLLVLALAGMALAGCGIEPTGVSSGGEAPTGVAPGPTLYFLDAQDQLRPSPTEGGRLGSVTDAVDLLLRLGDPSGGELHSDLPAVSSLGPQVSVADPSLVVSLPLARQELGPRGVDQVVCTALGVQRQTGDERVTTVVVSFTIGGRTEPLTCPAR